MAIADLTDAGTPADPGPGRRHPWLLRSSLASCTLIVLLQGKAIWRIWDLKDLTIGDTASYFRFARLWSDHLDLTIV